MESEADDYDQFLDGDDFVEDDQIADADQSHDDDPFSPDELKAIEVHKYYLSEKMGYDVGMDCAIRDWLKHHAVAWRGERLKNELQAQQDEIKKHKWIASEKAGCDLGDQAALDWVIKFAAQWRQYRNRQSGSE
jgi:hypothetical protein